MRRIHFGQIEHSPKTWKLDDWSSMNQQQRMSFLRSVSLQAGQNPEIATLAVNIFKSRGIKPRDYKGQANALFTWVKENIYYVNEPNERLQDPMYTLRVGYGDCDDMALLLGALCESVRLEYRFVLAGKMENGKVERWIEGEPLRNGSWSHIYLIIGYPPFQPKKWLFADPTVGTAKLGWDIVKAKNGSAAMLPELGSPDISEGDQYDKLYQKSMTAKIKEGLNPKDLIPTVIVAAITTVLVGEVAAYFRARLRKIRSKNQ